MGKRELKGGGLVTNRQANEEFRTGDVRGGEKWYWSEEKKSDRE